MSKVVVCLTLLVAIVGAEAVSVLVEPLWGIIMYFALLFTLIIYNTMMRMDRSHGFFLALGLVPLIRIVSLSMPLTELSLIYWYLIISIPLLAGVVAIVAVLNLHPSEIGLNVRAIPIQILVALSGIGIGIVDYLILRPESLISELSWREVVVPALILLVATGFVEEMIFRGVMQRTAQRVGPWGWIYVAAVSSVLQIGHRSVPHWLLAFGLALLFGWIVKRTGSILGVSLAHGLLNIGVFLIFPFVL